MADDASHQPSFHCGPTAMFVRFVVGSDAEDASWLTGVITGARLLLDAGELDRHEARRLDETFEWFNDHLPCPPSGKSSGPASGPETPSPGFATMPGSRSAG